MALETSLLQTLVAVGNAASFSKAAEDLHVTQSAISQSIKNLESKVGVKLVQRSGKRIHLTQEGQKLYDMAQDVLMKIEEAVIEIKENKASMSGKIRIGTFMGVGKSWLAATLMDFANENSSIRMDITLDNQANLIQLFEDFKLDCLVIPDAILPATGEHDVINNETAVLVYPKESDFGIDNEIAMDKIVKLPLILFQENDPLFRKWLKTRYGESPRRKLTGRFVINSHGQMLQAVSQGLGIAVVPNHVLQRSYNKDQVNVLDAKDPTITNRFYFVYHKEIMGLVRMKKLRDIILAHAGEFS
ncbi:MAG: LysR family transcriptional regulator [Bacteriovoracia bacterium]